MPSDSDNNESVGGQDQTAATRCSTRIRKIPQRYYGDLEEVDDNSIAGVQTMEGVEEMRTNVTQKPKKTKTIFKFTKENSKRAVDALTTMSQLPISVQTAAVKTNRTWINNLDQFNTTFHFHLGQCSNSESSTFERAYSAAVVMDAILRFWHVRITGPKHKQKVKECTIPWTLFHNQNGTPDTKTFSYDDLKSSYNIFKEVMTNDRLVSIESYETMKNKVVFYKKCVKYYLEAMRKNIHTGKFWECNMADDTHHVAILLSFKETNTPMKKMSMSKIEAVYNQNFQSALDRIQVDPATKRSYYVPPNHTLSEMQKSTVGPRQRKQPNSIPLGTTNKRYVQMVSRSSKVRERNDDRAMMDQQKKGDAPKPSPPKKRKTKNKPKNPPFESNVDMSQPKTVTIRTAHEPKLGTILSIIHPCNYFFNLNLYNYIPQILFIFLFCYHFYYYSFHHAPITQ